MVGIGVGAGGGISECHLLAEGHGRVPTAPGGARAAAGTWGSICYKCLSELFIKVAKNLC